MVSTYTAYSAVITNTAGRMLDYGCAISVNIKIILLCLFVQVTRLIKSMSMENHLLTNDILKDMCLKGTGMWTKTSHQVQSDFDHYLVQLQPHLNQKS